MVYLTTKNGVHTVRFGEITFRTERMREALYFAKYIKVHGK